MKIIKIIIKDNTGQTILSSDQKTWFDQKSKLLHCYSIKILLKEISVEPDQIE